MKRDCGFSVFPPELFPAVLIFQKSRICPRPESAPAKSSAYLTAASVPGAALVQKCDGYAVRLLADHSHGSPKGPGRFPNDSQTIALNVRIWPLGSVGRTNCTKDPATPLTSDQGIQILFPFNHMIFLPLFGSCLQMREASEKKCIIFAVLNRKRPNELLLR